MAGERWRLASTHKMKTQILLALKCSLLALSLGVGAAQAWHVGGKVVCDENGNRLIDTSDHGVAGVMIAVENASGSFTAVATAGADGTFSLELPHAADRYIAYLHPPTVPPGKTIILPAGGVYAFALSDQDQFFEQANFLFDCTSEEPPPEGGDCGKVTGGGWIVGTPTGAKASFGVSGGTQGAKFWGHLNYVDHGQGLHVRSTEVTGYDDDPASPDGRIIHYNVLIGTAEGTATVRVVDNGEPGAQDIFEITLSNGYRAGGELGGAQPGGGNIQLHKCPPGQAKDKGKDKK
jgi:hypothetical protein